MTARMLTALEEVPGRGAGRALVFGDTNSTLAAALAAVKPGIPVLHGGGQSAGLPYQSGGGQPHPDRPCVHNAFRKRAQRPEALGKENLGARAYLVGDPMLDAFVYYARAAAPARPKRCQARRHARNHAGSLLLPDLPPGGKHPGRRGFVGNFARVMESLPLPTLYPVHPRNRAAALRLRDALSCVRSVS